MITAYKFDSKNLGEAFLKELLEIGYEVEEKWGFDETAEGTGLPPKMIWVSHNNVTVHNHTKAIGAKKEFTLETDWNKALAFAKEQISKPEFKEGDWVIDSMDRAFRLVETDEHKHIGFLPNGNKYNEVKGYIRIATKDEIESALIKEAESRGLLEARARIKPVDGGNNIHWMYDCEDFHYDIEDDILFVHNRELYKNGKWAEVVENTKFFGWDVEYKSDGIHFAPDCSDGVYWSKADIAHIIRNLKQLDQKLTIDELVFELKKLDL